MNKQFLSTLLIIFTGLFFWYKGQSDTLPLTIEKADSLFIKNSFFLLAKKYNVDAQRALIQQARLLDNPSLYVEQNIYNSLNNRYFDMSDKGEYILQLQQLIYTAGKRNKRIQLAMLNHQMSLQEFNYTVSWLLFDLHQTIIQLYFYQKIKSIYDTEIKDLEPLVNLFQNQFEKGNISLKEVFRLKSLLFNVQSLSNQLELQIADLEKTIVNYLGLPYKFIKPEYPANYIFNPYQFSILSLKDTALQYRFDYQLAKLNVDFQKSNLHYQKALAVPDLHLGYTFDKAGNFITNYHALSFGIDLPFFNRNQGNIRAIQHLIQQTEAELKQKELEISNEIIAHWNTLITIKELYDKTQADFLKNFDNIKDGMQENFKKRNISVLEYADFFDSYINSVQQYYTLLAQYNIQVEKLNFLIGKKIIK